MIRVTRNDDIAFNVNEVRGKGDRYKITFYTVNSAVNIQKTDQDVTNGIITLNGSELMTIGEGVMNFRVDNIAPNAGYNDGVFNSSFTRTTKYYIVSAVIIPDGEDTETVIDLVSELQNSISSEITRSTNKDNAHDAALANVYTKAEIDDMMDDIDVVLPDNIVTDENYTHTDNNYTTTEKNKLAGLSNYDDTALDGRVSTLETSIDNKSDKSNTVSNIVYDLSTRKINKTINGTTSSVVTLHSVATSGNYNQLNNRPTIPTSTSQLTNDSNFVSDANYIHTDNNYTTTEKNKLAGLSNYDDTALDARVTANETALTNVYNKTQVDSKFTDIRSTTVGLFDGIDNYVIISGDYDSDFECNTLKFTDLYSGTESKYSMAPMGYALKIGKHREYYHGMPSAVNDISTVELYPGYNIMPIRLWKSAVTVSFTIHTPHYSHLVTPEYYIYIPCPTTAVSNINTRGISFDNILDGATIYWKDGVTPNIVSDVMTDRNLYHIIKITLVDSTTILGETIKYKS